MIVLKYTEMNVWMNTQALGKWYYIYIYFFSSFKNKAN